ncbi:hypothetical protein [uncultured Sphingomonas sp.]
MLATLERLVAAKALEAAKTMAPEITIFFIIVPGVAGVLGTLATVERC